MVLRRSRMILPHPAHDALRHDISSIQFCSIRCSSDASSSREIDRTIDEEAEPPQLHKRKEVSLSVPLRLLRSWFCSLICYGSRLWGFVFIEFKIIIRFSKHTLQTHANTLRQVKPFLIPLVDHLVGWFGWSVWQRITLPLAVLYV